MGGFDAGQDREVFKLPGDCRSMAMKAVGHQAEADTLDYDFKEAELAACSRAALNERFYVGQGIE
jgi:hypothetical protein